MLILALGPTPLAAAVAATEESSRSVSATQPESGPLVKTNSGPEALKQKVRVVATTNAPPHSGAPYTVPAREKWLKWDFSWQGWDGLHVEIVERTPLHGPFVNVHEERILTNNLPWVHLEEAKMVGRIGAHVQVDAAAFDTTGDLEGFDNGVQLRRLRIYAAGDCILVLPVSYELDIGYVPGHFYIDNSYLAFRNIPYIGEFMFGQFQPPMSLEALANSMDITFMEVAAPVDALAPGTSAGFQIGQPVFNQRATWALGMFAPGVGNDGGDASRDYGRVIGRVTWLPWYRADEANPSSTHLLHLGLSASYLYSSSSEVRYETSPESNIAPVVIDTGTIEAQYAAVVGLEAAWVKGPLSLQGEFFNSFVDESSGSLLHFHGFYGYVSWFLTGESRQYDRSSGTFTRVSPRRDFSFKNGGLGGWEIAGRVSHTDLNDGNISGGRMTLFTAGLTWYPHSHLRWKFNYIHGDVSGRNPSGNLNIFETRVEVDF